MKNSLLCLETNQIEDQSDTGRYSSGEKLSLRKKK
jgi:hypothetical protein